MSAPELKKVNDSKFEVMLDGVKIGTVVRRQKSDGTVWVGINANGFEAKARKERELAVAKMANYYRWLVVHNLDKTPYAERVRGSKNGSTPALPKEKGSKKSVSAKRAGGALVSWDNASISEPGDTVSPPSIAEPFNGDVATQQTI